LIINAIQAMSDLTDSIRGTYESATESTEEEVRVSAGAGTRVPGLSGGQLQQLFGAILHDKRPRRAWAMGLSIWSAAIVEEPRRGRLVASENEPHGALFQFRAAGPLTGVDRDQNQLALLDTFFRYLAAGNGSFWRKAGPFGARSLVTERSYFRIEFGFVLNRIQKDWVIW